MRFSIFAGFNFLCSWCSCCHACTYGIKQLRTDLRVFVFLCMCVCACWCVCVCVVRGVVLCGCVFVVASVWWFLCGGGVVILLQRALTTLM